MLRCFLGMLKDGANGERSDRYLMGYTSFNKIKRPSAAPAKFMMFLVFDGIFRILLNLVLIYKLYLVFQNKIYLKEYSLIFGIFSLGWYSSCLFFTLIIFPLITMDKYTLKENIVMRKDGPKCC